MLMSQSHLKDYADTIISTGVYVPSGLSGPTGIDFCHQCHAKGPCLRSIRPPVVGYLDRTWYRLCDQCYEKSGEFTEAFFMKKFYQPLTSFGIEADPETIYKFRRSNGGMTESVHVDTPICVMTHMVIAVKVNFNTDRGPIVKTIPLADFLKDNNLTIADDKRSDLIKDWREVRLVTELRSFHDLDTQRYVIDADKLDNLIQSLSACDPYE